MIIKVCGVSRHETLALMSRTAVTHAGFVCYPPSPRFVSLDRAATLSNTARAHGLKTVALVVNPQDALLDQIATRLRPDFLQLHGDETPERTAFIRERFGFRVLSVVKISSESDFATLGDYETDLFLFDAKPRSDALYPGGHGRTFKWDLLRNAPSDMPFLLAGGLTPENVQDAKATITSLGLNLAGLDVSSGVESRPGVKDDAKIVAFAARAAAF